MQRMNALGAAATFDLVDEAVVVAGDWHGNRHWVSRAIMAAAKTGARSILHLGSFGFWPRESADWLACTDYWVAESRKQRRSPGIERVLVTPGNHEDWGDLTDLFASVPGHAVQVSESVWVLPRAFRFTTGGRSVLSFGGGTSVDWAEREVGRDWWPSELPTVDDVARAGADGHADILLTHDGGVVHPRAVARVINDPMSWLTNLDRGYTSFGRFLVGEVVSAVTPTLHLHAHFGVRDSTARDRKELPPLRVEALSGAEQPGNLVLLNLTDLSVTDIDVPE